MQHAAACSDPFFRVSSMSICMRVCLTDAVRQTERERESEQERQNQCCPTAMRAESSSSR